MGVVVGEWIHTYLAVEVVVPLDEDGTVDSDQLVLTVDFVYTFLQWAQSCKHGFDGSRRTSSLPSTVNYCAHEGRFSVELGLLVTVQFVQIVDHGHWVEACLADQDGFILDCSLVVLLSHFVHPKRFPGDVDMECGCSDAGFDNGFPLELVRTHCVENHFGSVAHGDQALVVVCIGLNYIDLVFKLRQILVSDSMQFLDGSACQSNFHLVFLLLQVSYIHLQELACATGSSIKHKVLFSGFGVSV